MAKNFKYPAVYNFPPFFTIQEQPRTQQKQVDMWCDFILKYMKSLNVNEFLLSETLNSPLFHNKQIGRKLSQNDATKILDQLVIRNNARWKDEKTKDAIKIIWRKPIEWAETLHKWALENNYTNTVLTLYELREGEDTRGEPFHMMDPEIMKDALKELEKQKKAKFFDAQEFDECGVKFN